MYAQPEKPKIEVCQGFIGSSFGDIVRQVREHYSSLGYGLRVNGDVTRSKKVQKTVAGRVIHEAVRYLAGKRFVCSHAGTITVPPEKRQRKRNSKATGCRFSFQCIISENGDGTMRGVISGDATPHNHEPDMNLEIFGTKPPKEKKPPPPKKRQPVFDDNPSNMRALTSGMSQPLPTYEECVYSQAIADFKRAFFLVKTSEDLEKPEMVKLLHALAAFRAERPPPAPPVADQVADHVSEEVTLDAIEQDLQLPPKLP